MALNSLKVDRRRNAKYQPGKMIDVAQLDQSALECFYCVNTFPWCCCNSSFAQATYLDVYSNGVEIGKPIFCCCCCSTAQTSIGVHHHYDDMVVFNDLAMKGDICSPCPFCFVNCCGCFGETLVLRGKMCHGVRLFGLGNQHTTFNWCPCIASCMPITVMYGLSAGEADRIAALINNSAASYRSGQWAQEARIAAASGNGNGNGGAYVASAVMVVPVAPVVLVPAAMGVMVQQSPQQSSYQMTAMPPQPQQGTYSPPNQPRPSNFVSMNDDITL